MSTNRESQYCDECGRQTAKAHRFYKEHRYCSTCYVRCFKHSLCPRCGSLARLLKSDSSALCRKCETDKPCIRCGKTAYNIGKITPYGPVCNTCSPHFRKPEPCEVCEAPSSRLTRVSRLEHDYRVCPRCARAGYRTCQACSRHRQLCAAPDGRMLCSVCLEKGEIPCVRCKELMPAGFGRVCRQCYRKALLQKRIEMDCAAFSSSEMAAHFYSFGHWLSDHVGEHKAALTIHRYLPFFTKLERQWGTIPVYEVLLKYFGAAELRRVLLPMRWMQATGLVVPDSAARADDSERRRVVAKLEEFAQGSYNRKTLEGYYQTLIKSMHAGTTTLRSIRLSLSAASALLQTANAEKLKMPDQNALNNYLSKTPGQRAGISGFVRYLRDEQGVDIHLPKASLHKAQQRKKLATELMALMQEGGDSDQFKRKWLSVALAYFHGLDSKTVRAMLHADIDHVDGGLTIFWENKSYWLPGYPGSPG